MNARIQPVSPAATESVGAQPTDVDGAVVIDVRRAAVFETASTMLPNARWLDPAEVDTWAASLPAGRDIVVYCVYGHEVSRSVALRLQAAGLNARYLCGGIEAWAAAGHALVAKPSRAEAP